MSLGADAFHCLEEDGPAFIERLTTSAADIVAECIGKPEWVQRSLELVRPGGTVLSMGMCTVGDHFVPALAAFKQLRLLFPLAYSPSEYLETIRVFEADRFNPELMVSEVIGLDAFPRMLEAMGRGQVI